MRKSRRSFVGLRRGPSVRLRSGLSEFVALNLQSDYNAAGCDQAIHARWSLLPVSRSEGVQRCLA
jgi:hypothetical protein